jgi:hypothetical protein
MADVIVAPITPDPTGKLAARANARVERARAFEVVNAETYTAAATELQAIKALRGEVDAAFDPIIADANRAHKTALAQKAKVDEPLVESERIYKAAMAAYATEQKRLQQIEERQLLEQNQAIAKQERQDRVYEAQAYGASREELKAIAGSPLQIAPVVTTTTVPRVSGISSRSIWRFEVTSKQALDQFIAQNPQFSNLTAPNDAAIGGMARSLKSAMKIPGVRVWEESGIAAGRKA